MTRRDRDACVWVRFVLGFGFDDGGGVKVRGWSRMFLVDGCVLEEDEQEKKDKLGISMGVWEKEVLFCFTEEKKRREKNRNSAHKK
jgi:hypothetical protein